MEQTPFPWLEPKQLAQETAVEVPVEKPWMGILRRFKSPLIFVVVGLVILVVMTKQPVASTSDPTPTISVVAPVFPVAKGEMVVFETLRGFDVMKASVAKAQQFQLVSAGDLERLKGHVRAKKNLAPNKPLLWSDLVFATPGSQTQTPSIQVHYSIQQSPNSKETQK